MKRILSAMLAVLLGLGAACCTEASEGTPAVLTFASFDGGGPTYAVDIEDPEIVACARRVEYDDPNHEALFGAGYRVICTLTGLKPGETRLTVVGRSPVGANSFEKYRIVVDAALNVTAAPDDAGTIDAFRIHRFGELAYDSYEINAIPGGYSVSVNDGPLHAIDAETVDALDRVIRKYDLFAWDGFRQSRNDMLDGEGFSLEFRYADGRTVSAFGDNVFPEHYSDAIWEIQSLLDDAEAAREDDMGGFVGMLAALSFGKREFVVGKDVAFDAITDFYYTYATSTFPPDYQRYRFYIEDGAPMFFHETRAGDHWPLTEEDATVTGTLALTPEQWARFCACVEGGTARARKENVESGDSGPWLYLYWNGDKGKYQEFDFADWDRRVAFEALCAELSGAGE